MKSLLLTLTILCSWVVSSAQLLPIKETSPSSFINRIQRGMFEKNFTLPRVDVKPTQRPSLLNGGADSVGMQVYSRGDTTIYTYIGGDEWVNLGAASEQGINNVEIVSSISQFQAIVATLSSSTMYRIVGGPITGDFYYVPGDVSTPDDGAINIRTAAGQLLTRVLDGYLCPEFFGTTGTANDAPVFQLMFNWMGGANNRFYEVRFKRNLYTFTSTVDLPPSVGISAEIRRIRVNANGVKFIKTNGGTMFRRKPTDQSNALNVLIGAYTLSWEGGYFEGANVDGSIAMDINAIYSLEVKGSHFSSFDTALVSGFNLNGIFEHNFFTNNKRVAARFSSGEYLWPSGTTSNSAFNAVTLHKNRVFNANGSHIGFLFMAADGIDMDGHISEGFNPQYDIYVDHQGSTVVNGNVFRNIWFESIGGTNGSLNTAFYLRTQGTTTISGIQNDYADTIAKFRSLGGGSHFVWEDIQYWPTVGKLFDANSVFWSGSTMDVTNMAFIFANIFKDANYWVGNIVGFENMIIRRDEITTTNLNLFLRPNNNNGLNNRHVMIDGSIFSNQDNIQEYSLGGNYTGGIKARFHTAWFGSGGVWVHPNAKYGFGELPGDTNYLYRRSEAIYDFFGGGQLGIPSGNTDSRKTAQAGDIRYNTDSAAVEAYSTLWSPLVSREWLRTNFTPTSGLATVAITGNYEDLNNIPPAPVFIGWGLTGQNTFSEPIQVDTSSENGAISRWKFYDGLDSLAAAVGAGTVFTSGYILGDGTSGDRIRPDTSVHKLITWTKLYDVVDSTAAALSLAAADGSETKIANSPTVSWSGLGTIGSPYVATVLGAVGSNPGAWISITDFGAIADATVSGTTVNGTDATAAMNAAIAAASSAGIPTVVVPPGNFIFRGPLDTIKGPKTLNIVIYGNTYHNNAGNGVDFIIFANGGGGVDPHTVQHYGLCIGRVGMPTHSQTTHDNGTGPQWSTFGGTPFKIYNTAQIKIEFNRIEGFKNGIELIGWDYDNATRGVYENSISGRWLFKNANGITLTSINGRSYHNQNVFEGPNGGTLRITGGLAIKFDGFSGAAPNGEVYNGAMRNNKIHAVVEAVDSLAEVHADATENLFDITIEQGNYGPIGYRFRTVLPNITRGNKFTGQGFIEYNRFGVQSMGINGIIDVPIWDSYNGRLYARRSEIDGQGMIVLLNSELTDFQKDQVNSSIFRFANTFTNDNWVTTTAATYTPGRYDRWIVVNNSAHTFTLPTASSFPKRLITVFNDHSLSAITVSGATNYTSIPAGSNMTFVAIDNTWRGVVNEKGSGTTSGGGDDDLLDVGSDLATGTARLRVGSSAAPTAKLHAAASGGSAGTGSFKIDPGPLMGVPESGLFEHGTDGSLYFTGADLVKRKFVFDYGQPFQSYVVTTNTAYTPTAEIGIVLVNYSGGGSATVSLPAAASHSGRQIAVQNYGTSAVSVGNGDPNHVNTIVGGKGGAIYRSDGTTWRKLSFWHD